MTVTIEHPENLIEGHKYAIRLVGRKRHRRFVYIRMGTIFHPSGQRRLAIMLRDASGPSVVEWGWVEDCKEVE